MPAIGAFLFCGCGATDPDLFARPGAAFREPTLASPDRAPPHVHRVDLPRLRPADPGSTLVHSKGDERLS